MSNSKDGCELMNAQEVARMLGVCQETVWEQCKTGKIPAVKIGRRWYVRRSALLDMVGSGR